MSTSFSLVFCFVIFILAFLSPYSHAATGYPVGVPNPRIKPTFPALAGRFFTTEPPGKADKTSSGRDNKKYFPLYLLDYHRAERESEVGWAAVGKTSRERRKSSTRKRKKLSNFRLCCLPTYTSWLLFFPWEVIPANAFPLSHWTFYLGFSTANQK